MVIGGEEREHKWLYKAYEQERYECNIRRKNEKRQEWIQWKERLYVWDPFQ
jgi:hypothetical protein